MKRYIRSATDINDFEIENGILLKYHGSDTDIVIPEGVRVIKGFKHLEFAQDITSIKFPNSLEEIGKSVFANYNKLRSVVIPSSIKKIGEDAFRACVHLKQVNISGHDIEIDDGAFAGCVNLNSVIISGSVRSIRNFAFGWCPNLTSFELPDSVGYIEDNAFFDSSLEDELRPLIEQYSVADNNSKKKKKRIKGNTYTFYFGDGNSAASRGTEQENDIELTGNLSSDAMAYIAGYYLEELAGQDNFNDEDVWEVVDEVGDEIYESDLENNTAEDWIQAIEGKDIGGGAPLLYKITKNGNQDIYYNQELDEVVHAGYNEYDYDDMY